MTDPPLFALLREHQDVIVKRFLVEVQREAMAPPGLTRPLLVDHIPQILDDLVKEFVAAASEDASASAGLQTARGRKVARQHGEQRWSLGYELPTVMREYSVLRHCIVRAAEETACPLSVSQLDALSGFLNAGAIEATNEYVKFRDEQLRVQRENIEFLAEAGRLLSSSLDYRSTLAQLTSLIVPRLADWCSVQIQGVSLDSTPIAHVDPAQVELLRELYRRFPLPDDLGYGAPYAMRTGEPQILAELTPEILAMIAQTPEHADLIRRTGFCSGLMLPLTIQGNTFGVLRMSYGASGRHYDAADLVFAAELARRASVAIDNAKLFELSQAERSRAEAAMRAKDEFVALVSHELRTPLNAMLGWLHLMRGESFPAAKRAHALDVIERNARAQDRLVGDLLDISRIMTGKIRLNATEVDLNKVVELAVEGLRPALDAKRIALQVGLVPETLSIHGDSDRLQQVVWNLLANAVKFTRKNGRIDVRLQRVDSDVELVVEDDGEGIAPSFLPDVFGSFRQSDTSTSRTHGGLGLGLSIVKHLVDLHGGSVVAESPGVGLGATFRVRLPMGPLLSTTLGIARVPPTQPPAVTGEGPLSAPGVRVLVVDDDPDARELVAYLLESSGMEVRVAGSAADALAALETYAPHVIVSDIGMPGEDGYFLIRRIRTVVAPEKRDIPAIALTAFARNEDRKRALVEGYNVHLSKPVEPAALVSAVVSLAGPVREVAPSKG